MIRAICSSAIGAPGAAIPISSAQAPADSSRTQSGIAGMFSTERGFASVRSVRRATGCLLAVSGTARQQALHRRQIQQCTGCVRVLGYGVIGDRAIKAQACFGATSRWVRIFQRDHAKIDKARSRQFRWVLQSVLWPNSAQPALCFHVFVGQVAPVVPKARHGSGGKAGPTVAAVRYPPACRQPSSRRIPESV